MGFPTTSQCCCGCSLRTGVLILAYIGLIGTALNLLQYAALQGASSAGITGRPGGEMDSQKVHTANPVTVVIHGILSAMLLYGVYKESRVTILAVVYIQLAITVFYIVVVVAFAVISKILWILPIYFVALLLGYYFVWVEYSYAEELKEKTNNPKSPA